MRKLTRRGVSPVIATVMMVVITLVLSATVVVLVMSFNSSGGSTHYGSFAMVDLDPNRQYHLYFGSFQPRTHFSDVKVSIAGQIAEKTLSSYSQATPYSNSQVASMYRIDLGDDGLINVGDSLIIKFDASMSGRVVDVLIVSSANGDVIAGISLIVGAAPGPTPNPADYQYSVTDGKATIIGYIGPGGSIAIPLFDLAGHPVVAVGKAGFTPFRNVQGVTSVTMPDSVTSIGSSAFYNCISLTSVTIGNGVTTIGSSAFQSCAALTSVTIGNRVTTIADYAFESCAALTSVTIPNSVTSLGKMVFYYCTGLTSVTIGNSVTSIGSAEFLNCESLVSVTIPNSVISIGADAFHSCAKMVSVTLGSGVTIIEGNAFIYCTRLTSITFLGLAAPTSVGANWITGTNGGIRGHAPIGGVGYANPFYGLTMV